MRIELNTIGQVLELQGTSLFIGNEYDNKITDVFLEDVSEVNNGEMIEKISEIEKMLSEAVEGLKKMTVEAYHNEPMIEGSLDIGDEVLERA